MNTKPSFYNSICFFTGSLTLNLVSIQKIANQNQVQINLNVTPIISDIWDSVNFAAMVNLTNSDGSDPSNSIASY